MGRWKGCLTAFRLLLFGPFLSRLKVAIVGHLPQITGSHMISTPMIYPVTERVASSVKRNLGDEARQKQMRVRPLPGYAGSRH